MSFAVPTRTIRTSVVTTANTHCPNNLEQYLREYIEAAELTEGPLFRTLRGRSGKLNEKRLHHTECLAMIKRRCLQAGMEKAALLRNHTFRGTGITAYL